MTDPNALADRLIDRANSHRKRLGNLGYYSDGDELLDRQAATALRSAIPVRNLMKPERDRDDEYREDIYRASAIVDGSDHRLDSTDGHYAVLMAIRLGRALALRSAGAAVMITGEDGDELMLKWPGVIVVIEPDGTVGYAIRNGDRFSPGTFDTKTQQASVAEEIMAALRSAGAVREALIYLAGTSMNRLIAEGLPLEWTPRSGLGVAQQTLGCATVEEFIQLVRDNAATPPVAALRSPEGKESAPAPMERWRIPAKDLSDDDLKAELEAARLKFEDRGEHGGSPGEWAYERMGEIELEQARRTRESDRG